MFLLYSKALFLSNRLFRIRHGFSYFLKVCRSRWRHVADGKEICASKDLPPRRAAETFLFTIIITTVALPNILIINLYQIGFVPVTLYVRVFPDRRCILYFPTILLLQPSIFDKLLQRLILLGY